MHIDKNNFTWRYYAAHSGFTLPSQDVAFKRQMEDRYQERLQELKAEHNKALKYINKYRRTYGQKPLDPAESKWNHDDVIIYAKDLGWKK